MGCFMSWLLDLVAKFVFMVLILYFEIHPLDGFAFMEELNGFDLCEEVGSWFTISHLLVEDIFKGSGPCSIEFKSIDLMIEFLLPF